jgi:hypothetical protein
VNRFDPNTIVIMRAVLDEAAEELHISLASCAVRARMAETILRRATLGASRAQLKTAALEAGRIPET